MARERFTGTRITLHNVEHAVGHASFAIYLGQLDGAERREFSRLENHRVAARQCRCRLPTRDLKWVVPRADPRAHAERLAPRVRKRTTQVEVFAVQRRGHACEVFDAVGPAGNVDSNRFADRLTRVEHFEMREFVVARSKDRHRAVQNTTTFSAGHRRPDLEAALRRYDGSINIEVVRMLNRCEHVASRRIDGCKRFTRRCIGCAAIDEQAHGT